MRHSPQTPMIAFENYLETFEGDTLNLSRIPLAFGLQGLADSTENPYVNYFGLP